ncbi:hypothetical protein PR048_018175 [Dryococelus australis]|uniref:Uncharacterized protein n=1 Tax=Dryococelus australis TaxID=614101 RepID=A0ABQ9HBM7_9NEOP|nr:hypothetical protein PR048_018175 [Dryococelus australis]
MDQRRNVRPGKTGDSRENTPTSGVVRHDSHFFKYGMRHQPCWMRDENSDDSYPKVSFVFPPSLVARCNHKCLFGGHGHVVRRGGLAHPGSRILGINSNKAARKNKRLCWCAGRWGVPSRYRPERAKTAPAHLTLLSSFEAEKRESVKSDTATRIKCAIAAKHKALNLRAVFSSYCMSLRHFAPRHYLVCGNYRHVVELAEQARCRCVAVQYSASAGNTSNRTTLLGSPLVFPAAPQESILSLRGGEQTEFLHAPTYFSIFPPSSPTHSPGRATIRSRSHVPWSRTSVQLPASSFYRDYRKGGVEAFCLRGRNGGRVTASCKATQRCWHARSWQSIAARQCVRVCGYVKEVFVKEGWRGRSWTASCAGRSRRNGCVRPRCSRTAIPLLRRIAWLPQCSNRTSPLSLLIAIAVLIVIAMLIAVLIVIVVLIAVLVSIVVLITVLIVIVVLNSIVMLISIAVLISVLIAIAVLIAIVELIEVDARERRDSAFAVPCTRAELGSRCVLPAASPPLNLPLICASARLKRPKRPLPRVRRRTELACLSTARVGATVAERLARSPQTKANWIQSLAGSPDFRKWESCRTMPLVGGFSRGSPVCPAPSFRRRSVSPTSAFKTSLL